MLYAIAMGQIKMQWHVRLEFKFYHMIFCKKVKTTNLKKSQILDLRYK